MTIEKARKLLAAIEAIKDLDEEDFVTEELPDDTQKSLVEMMLSDDFKREVTRRLIGGDTE